jgi:hypothetical protein
MSPVWSNAEAVGRPVNDFVGVVGIVISPPLPVRIGIGIRFDHGLRDRPAFRIKQVRPEQPVYKHECANKGGHEQWYGDHEHI